MLKQAIILAGGLGSRLKTIEKTPKPLIKFNEKPNIVNLLNQIYLCRFKKIILLVKKNEKKIYEENLNFLANEVKNGLSINIYEEQERMGTGGWIVNNQDKLEDEFAVFNADTYFFENISDIIIKHSNKKKNIIIGRKSSNRNDAGNILIDSNYMVIKFEEKSKTLNSIESAGIYILNKQSLKELSESLAKVKISLEYDVFPELSKRKQLYAYEFLTFAHDYGVPERFHITSKLITDNKIKWLFLDRDNTLNDDSKSYTHKLEDLVRIKILDPLLRGFQTEGYHLCVITNQSGINRGFYSKETMNNFNNELSRQLLAAGINIRLFSFCPHKPDEQCSCRKPAVGMLEYIDKHFGINKDQSIMLGDSESDIIFAREYNLKSIKYSAS